MITELEKGVKLIVWDYKSIDDLKGKVESIGDSDLVVVTAKEKNIQREQPIREVFQRFSTDVLFAGTPLYDFDNTDLKYYYWKYYPRQESIFDYVDHESFIGKKDSILLMVDDLAHYDTKQNSLTDTFHRLYVDRSSGFIKSRYQIKIDHHSSLLKTSQRGLPSGIGFLNKIHIFLFLEYRKKNGRNSFSHYFKSFWKTLQVLVHNKGESRFYKLFRYAPNHGSDVKKSIDKLIDLLEKDVPFCFSHFNDGELTFISKYENSDHKEVWFGRRQNQYTEKLGKLLVEAFLLRKKNYFVGIPCWKSHQKLRKLATDLRAPDEYTIAAMTLHHNIDKYPRILGMLKKKKLYYITNPYQDLTFFSALGLEVKDENRVNVPFKNSHKEYDKLKDYKFEKDAVILMMCGMLGKVLTPTWFEQNPTCTFLTFGSSFDDMIQKNINFKLLPKEAPLPGI